MKKPSAYIFTFFVFFIFAIFYCYLAFTSRMSLECDAFGYDMLGRMIHDEGWRVFLQGGPQREPLYLAFIALSVSVSSVLSFLDHLKVQTIFQVGIMFLSMWGLWKILLRLGVRPIVAAISVLYFGISPAMINSVFSLFSEIATYPLMLGLVWFSMDIYEDVEAGHRIRVLRGCLGLALFLFLITMVKGVFEIVGVVFLSFWVSLALTRFCQRLPGKALGYVLVFILTLLVFQLGLSGYKYLNLKYNGNYLITERGPWHFYGNAVRRVEPLTAVHVKSALASVPGDGVCRQVASEADCMFWNFQYSDGIGVSALTRIRQEGATFREANERLLKDGIKEIGKAPFQYVALTVVEALKMFFWESTRIGFVEYPSWLARFYDNALVKNVWRGAVFLMTFMAFIWALAGGRRRHAGMVIMLWLAGVFIFVHALGSVLTRYAFAVVPVYIVLIACWADDLLARREA